MLVKPLLKRTHEQDGDDDGDDMPLISGLLYSQAKYLPHRDISGLHCSNAPCVNQIRMNHDEADNCGKIRIAAKLLRRADSNQDRKHGQSRACEQVDHVVIIAARKVRECICKASENTVQKSGCNDCGNNRNEDITESLDRAHERVLLLSSRLLRGLLRSCFNAGDADEFIEYLVYGSCAENDLKLTGRLKASLHAFYIFNGFLVDLAVVLDDKSQPRSTMSGGGDVGCAADIVQNALRCFPVIQCHISFLLVGSVRQI